MLNNSIATPSLVAAVINGKYTNAIPLYRQEQEYARNDVNISRQTMANWVITVVETAKANGLNIYQYFSHILTEIPKHMDDTRMEFLDDLLPWSDNLPDICRKKNIKTNKRRGVKSAASIISMHGWLTVYVHSIKK